MRVTSNILYHVFRQLAERRQKKYKEDWIEARHRPTLPLVGGGFFPYSGGVLGGGAAVVKSSVNNIIRLIGRLFSDQNSTNATECQLTMTVARYSSDRQTGAGFTAQSEIRYTKNVIEM